MQSIGELLQKKIEASKNDLLEEEIKKQGKEYHMKWKNAVKCFQLAINRERLLLKSPYLQLPYIAIQRKINHIKNIDDLRWFYKECLKSQRKKDGTGTFEECFWGSLKIRK